MLVLTNLAGPATADADLADILEDVREESAQHGKINSGPRPRPAGAAAPSSNARARTAHGSGSVLWVVWATATRSAHHRPGGGPFSRWPTLAEAGRSVLRVELGSLRPGGRTGMIVTGSTAAVFTAVNPQTQAGDVYLEFAEASHALLCKKALHGRTFAGRQVGQTH